MTQINLEKLLSTDVLEDNSQKLALSKSFLSDSSDNMDSIDKESLENELTDEEFAKIPDQLAASQTWVATFHSVSDYVDDATVNEHILLSLIVEQFRREIPAEGSPDGFLSVSVDRLSQFINVCNRGLVYIWRHDCDPCDTVRSDLETLLPDVANTDELMLLSVYGPEEPRLLHEEFDVSGGPTLLFISDGKVKARLTGAPYRDVLRNELQDL